MKLPWPASLGGWEPRLHWPGGSRPDGRSNDMNPLPLVQCRAQVLAARIVEVTTTMWTHCRWSDRRATDGRIGAAHRQLEADPFGFASTCASRPTSPYYLSEAGNDSGQAVCLEQLPKIIFFNVYKSKSKSSNRYNPTYIVDHRK